MQPTELLPLSFDIFQLETDLLFYGLHHGLQTHKKDRLINILKLRTKIIIKYNHFQSFSKIYFI